MIQVEAGKDPREGRKLQKSVMSAVCLFVCSFILSLPLSRSTCVSERLTVSDMLWLRPSSILARTSALPYFCYALPSHRHMVLLLEEYALICGPLKFLLLPSYCLFICFLSVDIAVFS